MSQEIDTAAAASLGGFMRWRRKDGHERPPGSPCANCSTPLMGPWCYACGQLGEDFHRSALKLAVEAVEGLFHLDGRLWRTLPDLALRPGRLTRQYLDGHRAPQIPPLRLFLVVLLAVFVSGSMTAGIKTAPNDAKLVSVTSQDDAKPDEIKSRSLTELTPQDREKLKQGLNKVEVKVGDRSDPAAANWLKARLTKVLDDPERFMLVLESWGERFAFLMLPLSALLLSLVFVFQRRFYLFDHIIFSLHSLSFVGLVLTVGFLSRILRFELTGLLMIAAPVHLFVHMRGVYQTSIAGTLARMAVLFFGTLLGGTLIFLGLLAVGLNAMVAG